MNTPLRRYRFEYEYTQQHLSHLSKVPQAKISGAENGYPVLSEDQRKRLAWVFGVPVEELFPDSEKVADQEAAK
ncbi:MAG: helix-turn-helix transcriptional regulator [Deltaproteobacteria bacterium]|nr:helix-turn-helix transcriptional regulator [Deltaproteobacteria bacterium]